MVVSRARHAKSPQFLFLADDRALDFINTSYGVGEDHRECLGSDAQVLDWLEEAGFASSIERPPANSGALLKAALELRKIAQDLVKARQAGVVGDVATLNRILAHGNSYSELVWSKRAGPTLEKRRRAGSFQALLVPVAEAVAKLLACGDFTLIRQCEGSGCILWFYDRTKAHRRRWCSMESCGNRMKVAAFRSRVKSESVGGARD
jgi:predicted RNA-binding Zn ribbon-like protein